MLMMKTIITVPKIAGKMPPSVFDSRGSSATNSQSVGRVVRRSWRATPMAFGK